MDILLVDDSISFNGFTPSSQPLGGVEKAFARLPVALRRRGHQVRVINRCDFPIEAEDVSWQPWDTKPPKTCDVLIAHRKPALLDFPVAAAKRILWLGGPAGAIRQDDNRKILARHSAAPIVFNGATHHVGCPIDLANRAITIEPGVRRIFREAEDMAPTQPPHAVTTVHPLHGLGWLLELWEKSLRPLVENAELHVFSAALVRGLAGGEVSTSIKPIFDRAKALADQGVVIVRPRADPDMAAAYREARVHLHPGHGDEVYCSTLAESQAVGLPAVTRRAAAAVERIRDGETGFVVPDDEAFANCAMLLLTADNVFEGRSEDARSHQRGRSWDDAAAEFETLFT